MDGGRWAVDDGQWTMNVAPKPQNSTNHRQLPTIVQQETLTDYQLKGTNSMERKSNKE